LQRADTDDGGSIIKAEIHLAKRPKLFRQTEPALSCGIRIFIDSTRQTRTFLKLNQAASSG
ncbi:hypothetical protein, partial [Sinorhizobium meliloti]|uniref:hypothetical protein n=1 Tax=Rhizobium meliloti TaxID=382 RepID=UPI001AEC781A